jgi:Tetracyclin repressor-like, C-terminal domain
VPDRKSLRRTFERTREHPLDSEIFRDWALTFDTVIEAGQKAGELSTALRPAQAARFLVNGLQGALLRCKVDRTPAALVDLEEIIFGLLLPTDKNGATGKAKSGRAKPAKKILDVLGVLTGCAAEIISMQPSRLLAFVI